MGTIPFAILAFSSPHILMATPSAMPGGGVELRVRVAASYANPFDPREVSLDAEFRAPGGKSARVPGFVYQPFRRDVGMITRSIPYNSTDSDSARTETKLGEILRAAGAPEWRVRFGSTLPANYKVELVLRDRNGVSRMHTSVSVPRASAPVQISGTRFVVAGEPTFPVGANMCWAGPRGTRDYDDWMPMLAKNGGDWARLWLSPNWATFALERKETGVGRFDLANAWRLDYVLDLARRNNVRLQFCIDSYNVLRDRINWPEWERSPQNRVNGGPLATPGEFWTDPEMERLYRAKLRYLVARYGWSPNVFAWEFWNEADGVTDYQPARVRDWHARMAKYLQSIDPLRHPITTSFGGFGEGAQDASVFRHLDFSQSHIYGLPDHAQAVERAQGRLGALGIPHFVGEFGADASGDRRDDDPRGYQIHDSLWASLGSAGGMMPWWWDSYLAPKKLYPIYRPFSEVVRQLGRSRFTAVAVSYVRAPKPLPMRDVVYDGGPISFRPSPENQPRRIRAGEPTTVSRVQHGTGNHPELHNPVTFETNFARPTPFVVHVASVSGYGGAGLRISLDGNVLLDRAFTDPDGDTKTHDLTQYVGDYRVTVTAGRHALRVENTGADWYMGGFRFVAAAPQTTPPIIARAHLGTNAAFVWLRHRDQIWETVTGGKPSLNATPSRISLPDLKGKWKVRFFDTWTGNTVGHVQVQAPVEFFAPAFKGDLGVMLSR